MAGMLTKSSNEARQFCVVCCYADTHVYTCMAQTTVASNLNPAFILHINICTISLIRGNAGLLNAPEDVRPERYATGCSTTIDWLKKMNAIKPNQNRNIWVDAFNAADKNGDEKVSREEFNDAIRNETWVGKVQKVKLLPSAQDMSESRTTREFKISHLRKHNKLHKDDFDRWLNEICMYSCQLV